MSRRRRFCPQGPAAGFPRRWWYPLTVGCAFMLLVSLGLDYLPKWLQTPYLAVLMVLTMAALLRGTPRTGVSVDDEGLTEWFALGLRRRWPWREVERIEEDEDGATLHTARRCLRLDKRLCDWRALLSACRRACARDALPESEAGQVTTAEEVAGWLGIAPGETLVLRTGRYSTEDLLGCGFLLLLTVGAGLATSWGQVWIVPAIYFGARAVDRRPRRITQVEAGADGLCLYTRAGAQQVAWAALLGIRSEGAEVCIETDAGDFWVPANLAERGRLLDAVKQAIAARERGQMLPRMAEAVPDTALSLTAAGEAEAERGLSRTDG